MSSDTSDQGGGDPVRDNPDPSTLAEDAEDALAFDEVDLAEPEKPAPPDSGP